MVDVRVREDHGIDQRRRERKMPVTLLGFLAMALIHAAIQKVSLAVGCEMVHGACYRAGGSPKGKFHGQFRIAPTGLVDSPYTALRLYGRCCDVASKALVISVLLLALAPATYLTWMAREMSHFGHLMTITSISSSSR